MSRIEEVLETLGLGDLLRNPRGLDQRLAENGRGLTAAQSLRLDLARAVLGEADMIVIASLRWVAEADRDNLLEKLNSLTVTTVLLAETQNTAISLEKPKVS